MADDEDDEFGVRPPDLPELAWGEEMEYQETAAWSSVVSLLKRAVDSGELVPGQRGWKTRQREFVRAHLNAPQAQLRGQSFMSAIAAERVEAWVDYWNGPTRQNVLGDLSERLLEPVAFPEGDLLPRWRWLLEQLDGGIPLTQNGNLGRAFVQENAERFGWDIGSPPRFEDDLFDLRELHALARRLRLTRRVTGRKLGLSPLGKRLLGDPEELWRKTAAALVHGDEFTVFVGELFLALVLKHGPIPDDQVDEVLERAAADEGFASIGSYQPPDRRAVRWARHETSNLCRALGMLAGDDPWSGRSCEFTAGGAAVAMEALRIRATGPTRAPVVCDP